MNLRDIIREYDDPLDYLALADAEMAARIREMFRQKSGTVTKDALIFLVAEVLWGMERDMELGRLLADGYATLAGTGKRPRMETYRDAVHDAVRRGLNYGRIMARFMVPVLAKGPDEMVSRFLKSVEAMRARGEYTLKKPLQSLADLLAIGDTASAEALLDLLPPIFRYDGGYDGGYHGDSQGDSALSYAELLHLSHEIPLLVAALPAGRRRWQLAAIQSIVVEAPRLADLLFGAMQSRLKDLSERALRDFLDQGLAIWRERPEAGANFIGLRSEQGRNGFDVLMVAVSLNETRDRLQRYLNARTKLRLSIAPSPALSFDTAEASDSDRPEAVRLLSDGRRIFLPERIDCFASREENARLYRELVRLEAAFYEFGTFDLDLPMGGNADADSRQTEPESKESAPRQAIPRQAIEDISDHQRLVRRFPLPERAADLLAVLELGRIRSLLERDYPGIVRSAFPMLTREAERLWRGAGVRKLKLSQWSVEPDGVDPFVRLYRRLVLGMREEGVPDDLDAVFAAFWRGIASSPSVNTCAALLPFAYERIVGDADTTAFRFPFDWRPRFDAYFHTFRQADRMAERIRERLARNNIRVRKSDVRKRLIDLDQGREGSVSAEDIAALALSQVPESPDAPNEEVSAAIAHLNTISWDTISWASMLQGLLPPRRKTAREAGYMGATDEPAFWYREWDEGMNDYLHRHVRVVERPASEGSPKLYPKIYEDTLERRYGLVSQLRNAFELLKPDRMKMLRKWVDGDAFDDCALLDYAVDRKAGFTPSDRLYIKRLKQQRDVAVLLLVDLSKSTSNLVPGTDKTVIDVEKEAIVLFCEALSVLGDAFAIAGFSGSGRHAVEYLPVKGFDEAVGPAVRARISGLSPRRNTRTGGAVRHAIHHLEGHEARVRILLLLGDGFPNDLEYKREYAVADTRKALAEAGAKRIHARAITVNVSDGAGLDNLYGALRHNVISDVRELPGKLLRIYAALTR